MNEIDGKLYWKGHPIDDLPKGALVAIIRGLMAQLAGSRATTQAVIELNNARRSA